MQFRMLLEAPRASSRKGLQSARWIEQPTHAHAEAPTQTPHARNDARSPRRLLSRETEPPHLHPLSGGPESVDGGSRAGEVQEQHSIVLRSLAGLDRAVDAMASPSAPRPAAVGAIFQGRRYILRRRRAYASAKAALENSSNNLKSAVKRDDSLKVLLPEEKIMLNPLTGRPTMRRGLHKRRDREERSADCGEDGAELQMGAGAVCSEDCAAAGRGRIAP